MIVTVVWMIVDSDSSFDELSIMKGLLIKGLSSFLPFLAGSLKCDSKKQNSCHHIRASHKYLLALYSTDSV